MPEDPARSEDQDPLDNLPPLDLPGEVTRSLTTPPTPPAAGPREEAPNPTTSRRQDAQAESRVDLASSPGPAPEPGPAAGAGQGMARFAPVDLKLAGGSIPSPAGLSWLAEKGYRTLLDLRPSSEVSPAFIAEVSQRRLRYVALPIPLQTIDGDHVARFNYEIGAGEARPLFFCDTDGTRAGALWYIRRMTVDRVDEPIARREAELLGLSDQAAWLAAAACVAKLNATQAKEAATSAGRSAADPAGTADSLAAPAAARPGQEPAASRPAAEAQGSDPGPAQPAATAEQTATAPGADRPQPQAVESDRTPATADAAQPPAPAASLSSNSMSWRPLAAMLLTGLSLPLAYWSRTLVPTLWTKARASLPAPGPGPQWLRHESGE